MAAILAYLLGRSSGRHDGYREAEQLRRPPGSRRYYTTRELRSNRRVVWFGLWCCTVAALHNAHVWPF